LVCRRGVGEFFLKTQLVDDVIEVKKGDAGSYEAAVGQLRALDINKVFSAHGSVRTAFFIRQLEATEKIGFMNWWNRFFYDRRVVKDLSLPDAIRQMSLLLPYDKELQNRMLADPLAAGTANQPDGEDRLSPPPAWASMSLRSFYQAQTRETGELFARLGLEPSRASASVALFPGSVWATKRWTKEGFIGTGQQLRARGMDVLVMGGPGEESLCAEVAAAIPGAKDLCGKTKIYESALVLSQVAGVVGNDSASLHLAATCETPSVAVFGPTVLSFGFRPWQQNAFIAEYKDLPCRPCGKHGHQVCPIGTHACMKQISAEAVGRRLEKALALAAGQTQSSL
jgi:heptosyltransferase-2